MRIRVLSDLHFEFHQDGGQSFAESLYLSDPRADAVVIAGDLSNAAGLGGSIRILSQHARDVPIFYVHGNHEFYGSGRTEVLNTTAEALVTCSRADNFLPLNRDSMIVTEGHRILGCSLWFEPGPMNDRVKKYMADFRVIQNFESWVYEENGKDLDFLRENLAEGDIVVTHHLPSWQSVSPRFKGSALNCFFVCDVEKLILERKPRLWIHGHTHDSKDYMLGSTRVVCNPYGYQGHEVNPEFDPNFEVEV